MRPLLHLISVVLVLPVFGLASAFIILGRAIAAGSLVHLLLQLLADALWLFPWGLLAIGAALLTVALGGFFVRTRWMAGLCVAILGIVSTGIVLTVIHAHSSASLDELPFLVPGMVASGVGLWFASSERPRHPPVSSDA